MLNLQFQFARQAFLEDYKRHYLQTEIKIENYPERTAYSWQWHNRFSMKIMMARNDSRNSMLMKCQQRIWVFIPGGVLHISSDRDHQRIFWGVKFLIPGKKFGNYFFGSLDFSRDFFFIFKTI